MFLDALDNIEVVDGSHSSRNPDRFGSSGHFGKI